MGNESRLLIALGAVVLFVVLAAQLFIAVRVEQLGKSRRKDFLLLMLRLERVERSKGKPCQRIHAANLPDALLRVPVPTPSGVRPRPPIDEEHVNPVFPMSGKRL